jgi:hypothetical protein
MVEAKEAKKIVVPVATWVQKLLTKQYGSEIKLSYNNIMGSIADHQWFVAIGELDFTPQKMVGDTIVCSVSERLCCHYLTYGNDRLHALGMFWERYCHELMVQFVFAQVRAGRTIVAALDDFYKYYGIDEFDLNSETAMKFYQRHRMK